MAGLTHFGENLFIKKALIDIDNYYVGLLKEAPRDDSTNIVEISASSYARQKVSFNNPQNGETYNKADITFPTARENWGWVTHIGLFDNSTSGNLICFSQLDYKKEIRAADIYKIPQAFFIFKLD